MQKDKQPQDEKVIQKLNARAQTFAANTLRNAGQKRMEQVIQWNEDYNKRIGSYYILNSFCLTIISILFIET